MDDRICIDRGGAEFFEDSSDGALAGSDAAGEADSFRHAGSIARLARALKVSSDLDLWGGRRGPVSLSKMAFCIERACTIGGITVKRSSSTALAPCVSEWRRPILHSLAWISTGFGRDETTRAAG